MYKTSCIEQVVNYQDQILSILQKSLFADSKVGIMRRYVFLLAIVLLILLFVYNFKEAQVKVENFAQVKVENFAQETVSHLDYNNSGNYNDQFLTKINRVVLSDGTSFFSKNHIKVKNVIAMTVIDNNTVYLIDFKQKAYRVSFLMKENNTSSFGTFNDNVRTIVSAEPRVMKIVPAYYGDVEVYMLRNDGKIYSYEYPTFSVNDIHTAEPALSQVRFVDIATSGSLPNVILGITTRGRLLAINLANVNDSRYIRVNTNNTLTFYALSQYNTDDTLNDEDTDFYNVFTQVKGNANASSAFPFVVSKTNKSTKNNDVVTIQIKYSGSSIDTTTYSDNNQAYTVFSQANNDNYLESNFKLYLTKRGTHDYVVIYKYKDGTKGIKVYRIYNGYNKATQIVWDGTGGTTRGMGVSDTGKVYHFLGIELNVMNGESWDNNIWQVSSISSATITSISQYVQVGGYGDDNIFMITDTAISTNLPSTPVYTPVPVPSTPSTPSPSVPKSDDDSLPLSDSPIQKVLMLSDNEEYKPPVGYQNTNGYQNQTSYTCAPDYNPITTFERCATAASQLGHTISETTLTGHGKCFLNSAYDTNINIPGGSMFFSPSANPERTIVDSSSVPICMVSPADVPPTVNQSITVDGKNYSVYDRKEVNPLTYCTDVGKYEVDSVDTCQSIADVYYSNKGISSSPEMLNGGYTDHQDKPRGCSMSTDSSGNVREGLDRVYYQATNGIYTDVDPNNMKVCADNDTVRMYEPPIGYQDIDGYKTNMTCGPDYHSVRSYKECRDIASNMGHSFHVVNTPSLGNCYVNTHYQNDIYVPGKQVYYSYNDGNPDKTLIDTNGTPICRTSNIDEPPVVKHETTVNSKKYFVYDVHPDNYVHCSNVASNRYEVPNKQICQQIANNYLAFIGGYTAPTMYNGGDTNVYHKPAGCSIRSDRAGEIVNSYGNMVYYQDTNGTYNGVEPMYLKICGEEEYVPPAPPAPPTITDYNYVSYSNESMNHDVESGILSYLDVNTNTLFPNRLDTSENISQVSLNDATIEQCEDKCNELTNCGGFTRYRSPLNPSDPISSCRFVYAKSNVNDYETLYNRNFDLYLVNPPRHLNPSDPVHNRTNIPEAPVEESLPDGEIVYRRNEGKIRVPFNGTINGTLAECESQCTALPDCGAFSRNSATSDTDTNGICYYSTSGNKAINDSSAWNLFIKDRVATTSATWEEQENKYHTTRTPDGNGITLTECKNRCMSDSSCEGITFYRSVGNCFKSTDNGSITTDWGQDMDVYINPPPSTTLHSPSTTSTTLHLTPPPPPPPSSTHHHSHHLTSEQREHKCRQPTQRMLYVLWMGWTTTRGHRDVPGND